MASYTNRGTKKKPSWQYTISHKPKPIRKGGFKTKKEAEVAAAEIEAELRKGVVPQLKFEPFDDYFESWVKVYKSGIGDNTRARYNDTLQSIREYFGNKPIQEINKRSYQEFLNEYAKKHAKSTTRKLNTHIRACVRDAVDEGVIRVDFTRGAIISGDNKEKRPEEKHLNFGDSETLLKELYKRLEKGLSYYVLLLGLTSGMRYAEMMGLTRKDFNFDKNEINIDKTWGYTKKMHKGFGPTKNDQSVRKIKMDHKTMQAFKRLFELTPDNIHRLVFFSPSSKYNVISNTGSNKLLKNLLKELEIERQISVHGLRHTHASVLLYQQVSLYYVSERLGHADIETTMNTYTHIVKELREQDEEKTADVFENMVV
ncbi:site-specific recombinase XerD [Scopulibacillus darangshiensis]|uniref:Site-specific recombinase XerD n=1 Tax=Scopulibacillus darangshiensis TaxID=442528 RepID=A0A4R2PCK0_9BACL|nr:site-specific integrase [Scopulibacillus darangshiensis]TCP32148.1 site-specific recombinase XerD [Scopulibacillus darangshiensis]